MNVSRETREHVSRETLLPPTEQSAGAVVFYE
nr:MAG TPA: hypothetical protein [Caudoviricetes sp.]